MTAGLPDSSDSLANQQAVNHTLRCDAQSDAGFGLSVRKVQQRSLHRRPGICKQGQFRNFRVLIRANPIERSGAQSYRPTGIRSHLRRPTAAGLPDSLWQFPLC